jgi:hypothetical protein
VGTAVPQPNYTRNIDIQHVVISHQHKIFIRRKTDAKTHLEHARPPNPPPRRTSVRRCRRCRRPKDVPIEVRREIERAFPRLEPALVRARDEVSRRIDKGRNSSL